MPSTSTTAPFGFEVSFMLPVASDPAGLGVEATLTVSPPPCAFFVPGFSAGFFEALVTVEGAATVDVSTGATVGAGALSAASGEDEIGVCMVAGGCLCSRKSAIPATTKTTAAAAMMPMTFLFGCTPASGAFAATTCGAWAAGFAGAAPAGFGVATGAGATLAGGLGFAGAGAAAAFAEGGAAAGADASGVAGACAPCCRCKWVEGL